MTYHDSKILKRVHGVKKNEDQKSSISRIDSMVKKVLV